MSYGQKDELDPEFLAYLAIKDGRATELVRCAECIPVAERSGVVPAPLHPGAPLRGIVERRVTVGSDVWVVIQLNCGHGFTAGESGSAPSACDARADEPRATGGLSMADAVMYQPNDPTYQEECRVPDGALPYEREGDPYGDDPGFIKYIEEMEAIHEGRATELLRCEMCLPYEMRTDLASQNPVAPLRGIVERRVTVGSDPWVVFRLNCGHDFI